VDNGYPAPRLRGRHKELAALERLVAGARSGQSQVLVLRGEAGVGKTALLEYAVEHAAGFRIARVAGVESEMELAFAGLEQLCAPYGHHLDSLPSPQRDALDIAFGRSAGTAPDRFLVGLAILSLLAAAGEGRPLLCVVDDAQWLDRVSVQTLGFVARRLAADSIAMVFAVRDGADVDLAGLSDMTILGLATTDARALLESVIPGRLDKRVSDRIVAETRGNPLALLELPRDLSAAELAVGFGRPDGRPLTGQIEQCFLGRVQSLPKQTQRLLLIAAAEPAGDVALLMRAADLLGIPADAVAPAEAAALIEIAAQVRFRHPLVRSAAYRAADPSERRSAHHALAEATDPEVDPDRRAWHRASAAAGPDEAVATELERSADRAQARGGIAAAAAFLQRATELTSDPDRHGARLVAAAQAKREAAALDSADELITIAESMPLNALQHACLVRLRAQIQLVRSRGGEHVASTVPASVAGLLDAARQFEPLDSELARDTYLEALCAAMYGGRLCPECSESVVAKLARNGPPGPQPLRPTDLLLDGLTLRIAEGPTAGIQTLRSALTLICAETDKRDSDVMRWFWQAFPIAQEVAAHELWNDQVWDQLSADAVRLARDTGALAVLPVALVYRAGVHVQAADFATATELIEEADAITAATGYAPVKYHSLVLAAWHGNETEAMRLIDAAVQYATARGEGRVVGLAGYATALLNNGLGHYDVAFAAAKKACEHDDVGLFGWCLVELIEAGARCGEDEHAAAALRHLEEQTLASSTDWALGVLAGCRALLADDEAAEDLYLEAIDRLEKTRIAVHLARVRLLYGEWLRRANRRVDSRVQLHAAYESLARIGAEAFSMRARREIQATGERVHRRSATSTTGLTPQQARIARLAADGHTNSEIAAQLFISVHTVEFHLRKVFPKLGITSRRQLRAVRNAL
jgi:DNA-binding CsgD family transcriptional regulator